MTNGSVVKCMAIYDEPFWRADGLSGQGVGFTGPVKVFFDNSPPSGRPGVLLGFLEGSQARELGRADTRTRREAVIGCFARMFGPRAARPVDYVEKVWAADQWRSEEHTSELQSRENLVCRLLLEKKNYCCK